MEVDDAYDEVEEESEVEREDPFVTDSQEEGHDDDCEVSIYIYIYIYIYIFYLVKATIGHLYVMTRLIADYNVFFDIGSRRMRHPGRI